MITRITEPPSQSNHHRLPCRSGPITPHPLAFSAYCTAEPVPDAGDIGPAESLIPAFLNHWTLSPNARDAQTCRRRQYA